MRAYSGLQSNNSWSPSLLNDYAENITYDPNGNIRYYTRNGAPSTGAAQAMDDLEYSYYENTNRLRRVTDNVAGSAYSEDLENQTESDNLCMTKLVTLP